VSSVTTNFTWSPTGADVPLLLEDATSNYIYGVGDTPVEQIAVSGGTTSYLMSDDMGTVRGITNSSGSVTGMITYDAWGNVSGTSGTIVGVIYWEKYPSFCRASLRNDRLPVFALWIRDRPS